MRRCREYVPCRMSDSDSSSTTDDEVETEGSIMSSESSECSPDPIYSDLSDEDESSSSDELTTAKPQEHATDEEATEIETQSFDVTVSEGHNSLHLQPRVACGGFVYSRRKRYGDKSYFCCVHKKCPAGFRYSCTTHVCIPNGKKHNHPPMDLLKMEMKKNLQQICLRKFVEDHYNTGSRQIYAMILKEQENDPEKYPRGLSVKVIQNVKGQLVGEKGRHLLDPTLPPNLREVDGVDFLAFQCVRPVILIFATEQSLKEIVQAQMLFLQKLHVKGCLLNHVYCVYSVATDRVVPCIWLAFQTSAPLPWMTLQSKIVEAHEDPIRWVIPWKKKGYDLVDALLRKCDCLMGVKGAYERKVDHLVAKVEDKELRQSLAKELKRLSALPVPAIEGAVLKLKQQAQDKNIKDVTSKWDKLFTRNTMWYHETNCCEHAEVIREYEKQRQRPKKEFSNDSDVIRFIHQQYQEHLARS